MTMIFRPGDDFDSDQAVALANGNARHMMDVLGIQFSHDAQIDPFFLVDRIAAARRAIAQQPTEFLRENRVYGILHDMGVNLDYLHRQLDALEKTAWVAIEQGERVNLS